MGVDSKEVSDEVECVSISNSEKSLTHCLM